MRNKTASNVKPPMNQTIRALSSAEAPQPKKHKPKRRVSELDGVAAQASKLPSFSRLDRSC